MAGQTDEFGIADDELLLLALLCVFTSLNLLDEEFLEVFRDLALADGGYLFYRGSRVAEAMDTLQLQQVAAAVCEAARLLAAALSQEIAAIFELEEAVTQRRLVQHEHGHD